MIFESKASLGPELSPQTGGEVKNALMMFNCRGDWVLENGDELGREFVSALLTDTGMSPKDVVVDSKVHMLFPRHFPCIPGFHHDDVPRLREDGQPYYYENEFELGCLERRPYRSQHAMAMYGDEICPTRFALGEANFSPVPYGETLYKVWHPEVEQRLADGRLTEWFAPMHRIVYFDDRSWHAGQQANGNGWRFFIRASWDTDRTQNCTNEIRRQVQVYMENPVEGW